MRHFFPILKACTLLSGIPDEDFEAVLTRLQAHVKDYAKGQVIRYHETDVTEIGIVLKGTAYITKLDVYGNRNILAEVSEGRTFGESLAFANASNSPISIVAAENITVALFPVKRINEMLSLPDNQHARQIAGNLIRLLAEKCMLLQMKNDVLSQKTIREKLLLYFEYESKTTHSKTFRVHFSREELADFLSLNSNALSRELGKMRDEGLLTFKKNQFTLKT